eukprot:gene34347-44368_t
MRMMRAKSKIPSGHPLVHQLHCVLLCPQQLDRQANGLLQQPRQPHRHPESLWQVGFAEVVVALARRLGLFVGFIVVTMVVDSSLGAKRRYSRRTACICRLSSYCQKITLPNAQCNYLLHPQSRVTFPPPTHHPESPHLLAVCRKRPAFQQAGPTKLPTAVVAVWSPPKGRVAGRLPGAQSTLRAPSAKPTCRLSTAPSVVPTSSRIGTATACRRFAWIGDF